jgi:hypothetical protein
MFLSLDFTKCNTTLVKMRSKWEKSVLLRINGQIHQEAKLLLKLQL